MTVQIKVPSVGESITEVTIANWIKKTGDYVKMDEAIAEVESDKATVELNASAAGVLKLLVEVGTTVAIGAVVAEVDDKAAKPADAPAAAAAPTPKAETKSVPPAQAVNAPSSTTSKNFPSPSARKILDEKGIDAGFTGTGKDGRITKADAMAATASSSAPSVSSKPSAPVMNGSHGGRQIEKQKMSMLRKTIAKRLVAVKNNTAMLTTFNEVDMAPVMELRKKYKEQFKEKHGVGLGFMSLFTKAACLALKNIPAVNAQIEGEDIVYFNYADVGIAVSTPKGLVVPVVRNAESLSLADIEKEIARLALKARDGKISVEDMSGGTFTITNGGVFGSMLSTPILNAPQSAILGMHNIVERPVALNGQVVIRPIMYLALSYDHRIVDGKESVTFLKTIKEVLEDPARLILDV
ncbi:MAG: 2-oxoglutarate dehydrogenase complex dihydrolipoyllysine-residue succinyltransferase [Bacteriovoracaceae bacterium]|nr:2-oxoglutarate dehydrogenase complex dihydrolipoyllysine-residue succinyltransferase [Bacteriovoracaceae bacterium]